MINEFFFELYKQSEVDLKNNLLPWWIRYLPDEINGGYFGKVGFDGNQYSDAPKFIVLNGRMLWTFSAAYRLYHDEAYKTQMEYAYKNLINNFYDQEYGGFFTLLGFKNFPLKDHKMIYGNSFSIYALTEYIRAEGINSDEANKITVQTVELFENMAKDKQNGGYYETFNRDWTPAPEIHGVNRSINDKKTMNTHLHILEAYTNVHKINQNKDSAVKLRYMLDLFIDKIINKKTNHFHFFQDEYFNPTTDDISFGHDIEGSWLLLEAAEALGENEIVMVKGICEKMAEACYNEGFINETGAMRSEYKPQIGIYSKNFSWWEQTESVVGFLNAFEMTGDKKYFNAAKKAYGFIDNYLIDKKNGGWNVFVNGDYITRRDGIKADGYICPYHSARMCYEIKERYERR